MRPGVRIGIGVAALLLAVGLAAGQLSGLQGTTPTNDMAGRPAPAFTGLAGWINSPPLTVSALRGKVVLVDFWTYSCINCVRTFGHLRALDDRYRAAGLQIVGMHSPEFEFEKDRVRVEQAVQRHGLMYPVALDNDMATWRAYRNNYWPHVYLIDGNGVIRYDHIGEGGDDEIEAQVRRLLAEAGAELPAPLDEPESAMPNARITPEIYAGFERGTLANSEGYRPQETALYTEPTEGAVQEAGANGLFFLGGTWRAEREYIEATERATVIVRFRARNVFMVAAPGARATEVRITVEGTPPFPGQPNDESLTVDSSDLFDLLKAPRVVTRTLRLTVDPGFRLYAFTFG